MKKLKSNIEKLSKLLHDGKQEQTILYALKPHLRKIDKTMKSLLRISKEIIGLTYELIELIPDDEAEKK